MLGLPYTTTTTTKSLQSCPTLCCPTHELQPTRLFCPWDSPGKNTGVGCHFLLQCMKVESESEVAQSCPTLSDPMDCSPPGSSVRGIFQARVLEWGAIAFSVSSYNSLYFKVYFVSYKYCYSSFLWIFICMEILFPSLHIQSVCVSRSEGSLL